MKIFMIGGTGNISSPITQRLLQQGHNLTLYNHDAQPPTWLHGANVVTGNRKDYDALECCVADLGAFDCAIDMLCFDPADAASDIRAFRGRTQQFIVCSTVDVYTVSFEQGAKKCLDWLTSHGKIEDCENYPFYDRIIERLSAHQSALISEFQTNPV